MIPTRASGWVLSKPQIGDRHWLPNFMTLAGMLIRAAAMPVYRGHELKIVLLLALAVIAAFTLPPILLTSGKRVIWRLW